MDVVAAAPSTPGQTHPTESAGWPTSVDIVETETRVLLFLDMPGMTASEFSVEYAAHPPSGPPGGTLSVSGVRPRPALEGRHRVLAAARFAGQFTQQVVVPLRVEPASLKASYKDGVLMVRINKARNDSKPVLKLNFGGQGAPMTTESFDMDAQ